MIRSVCNACITLTLLCLIGACTNTKKATYFDITKDSTVPIIFKNAEPPIQKNDILSISVSSLSAEASQLYNNPNREGSASDNVPGGYLVNKDGNILFPVLGYIKAEGLTKEELQKEITNQLLQRKLLVDPIISIRQMNYKVTILGEVAHPQVINIPSEKISILEAIGFAGDLTIYSNRSNVMIIREENNQRTFKLIDLNSNEIFDSPYFYLKPNDVVYVRPNKSKVAGASTAHQWLPTVVSIMSFTAIILTRVINN